jgi:predicted AlkP superfamily phosphohydrolase/phosphomutase
MLSIRATAVLAVALLLAAAGCDRRDDRAPGMRVVILGFDGMDYSVTKRLLEEGKLPHLAGIAAAGGFQPLTTSVPPQSPVAWSDFITGLDAGGHGIFDFVHRDPATMLPYLSTTRTEPPSRVLHFGKWQLPLGSGRVTLLRDGIPFWQVLEARGVPAWIMRMPANFPPSGKASRELSGMGTPDILGTYGTFSFYTTSNEPPPQDFETQVHTAALEHGVFRGELRGPPDPFRRDGTDVSAPFAVYVDAARPVAKVVLGDAEVVLMEGEWSAWLPVEFELSLPFQSLPATVRFYLKQVRPELEVYATPVNLDPLRPALPISTPKGFAADVARATGRFYTQGMPEDTKALTAGVFNRDDFLRQAAMTAAENRGQFHWLLERFAHGLLFYYFGHIDQVSHMMWAPRDPTHPGHDPVADAPYADVVENLYLQADTIVGEVLARLGPNATVIVMSDHGFTSWKRAVNLNTFLRQRGYLAVNLTPKDSGAAYFAGVDWSRTQAYGLGLNGLYLNLRGRERVGVVPPDQRALVLDELSAALLRLTDPATGERVVARVYRRDEVYEDGDHPDLGPDLIVGYAKGYRGSNESALGQVTLPMITDNLSAWSGDHAMVHDSVPGVLFTSRPLSRRVGSLRELASAVLAEFGIHNFPRQGGETSAR